MKDGLKETSAKYLYCWNPGLNNNTGGTQIISYKSSGTTLAYNNTTWVWTYSVSYYP